MTTKRRMDYRVDEDALKRMMAGDVTALEETVPPAEALGKEAVPFRETQDKKASASPSKKQTRKLVYGGFKCHDYVNRYPGRFANWHLKDANADGKGSTEMGAGIVDFKSLFAVAEKAGSIRSMSSLAGT